ncbi:MAG TPA: DUF4143 domain-containing protein, partial [Planctomycetota bacterium]|nr:DUF4143 domain-containing protein [Planctomycetota bacterium]
FFDRGVVRALCNPASLESPLPAAEVGPALEHLVFQELHAYQQYFARDVPLAFWRTYGKQEVNFVFGDVAIEVKASASIANRHLKGLRALASDYPLRRQIVVCREPVWRRVGDIEIHPVRDFLTSLWAHDIVK